MDSIIVNAPLCPAISGRGKHKPVIGRLESGLIFRLPVFADSVINLPVREYTYHRNSE